MAAPKLERLKAADVCQLAQLQPYMLRSWEVEFPDLGQATAGGPRFYSRADVERVLKIRDLIVVEGLTLAGARRRLEEEADQGVTSSVEDFLADEPMKVRLRSVRQGLQDVLVLLDRPLSAQGPPGETTPAEPVEVPVRKRQPKAAKR